MTPLERRRTIGERLRNTGVIRINDLADELGVSSMTIRRDLQHFIRHGVVAMSNGSAYLLEGTDPVPAIVTDATSDARAAQKRAIGQAAAELVEPGDTIIVDCGTTTLQMLRFLGDKQVTIVTNSIPVAALVGGSPHIQLIYAPGEYSEESMGLVGTLTVDFYHTLNADKAFLGANGFDAHGANEPVVADASTKRAILAAAKESYLLVDSSKYGNVHLMSSTRLDAYTRVITDAGFPEERRAELEAACRAVTYA